MTKTLEIITPIDASVYAQLKMNTLQEAHEVVRKAHQAQKDWAHRSIQERAQYCTKFLDAFLAKKIAYLQQICP